MLTAWQRRLLPASIASSEKLRRRAAGRRSGTHLLSGCCYSAAIEALRRLPRTDLATATTGVARPGPLSTRSGRGGGAPGLGRREEGGRDQRRPGAWAPPCCTWLLGEGVVAASWGGRSWLPAPLEPRRRWLLSDLGGGVGLRRLGHGSRPRSETIEGSLDRQIFFFARRPRSRFVRGGLDFFSLVSFRRLRQDENKPVKVVPKKNQTRWDENKTRNATYQLRH